MKQLEITTNKRLLIVEFEDEREAEIDLQTHIAFPESDKTAICLGSDFDEEIAKEYIINILAEHKLEMYEIHNATDEDFKNDHWAGVTSNALESFISFIESKGWHWGSNPIEKPHSVSYYYRENYGNNEFELKWDYLKFEKDQNEWKESESRTFNPSKCIIFEIL
ncbi:hypothetical protein [Chryseobacterium sediminis]|uniref:Uncharacterized protein n=1 Tax=Chryseobacterium sediminis TaxID=1679494 RepID=A0A5B2U9C2_9FLAO|nr:hypothetical protein [Chryseobacterium sediminis]KAA2223023.1 hypothetical protein FW780_02125 [Chryseobacterium sediminis]